MSGNKYIITQGVTTSMEKNRIRPIPTGKKYANELPETKRSIGNAQLD